MLGYYALPLLWHDRVIGWSDANVVEGRWPCSFGYAIGAAPAMPGFRDALAAEEARMKVFLGLIG